MPLAAKSIYNEKSVLVQRLDSPIATYDQHLYACQASENPKRHKIASLHVDTETTFGLLYIDPSVAVMAVHHYHHHRTGTIPHGEMDILK